MKKRKNRSLEKQYLSYIGKLNRYINALQFALREAEFHIESHQTWRKVKLPERPSFTAEY